ncbi:MAG: phosphatidate cytidylyltransferase [Spirochaetota bacterium]
MKTLTKRILLTVLGVPLFFSSIFFFPQQHFLFFCLIAILFSLFGSFEVKKLIHRTTGVKPFIHSAVVGILPATVYIQLYVTPEFALSAAVYTLAFLVLLGGEVFLGAEDNFADSYHRMSLSLLHLIYPSALCMFVIAMTAFNQASFILIYFFLMIFANDVFAYVFGMLFGRSSRGIVAVSPNKSLIGFIGGFVFAIGFGLVFYTLITPLHNLGPLSFFLILSGVTAIGADIGDLAESVLKRSSATKDSGSIIPGRGGILDTIDSIVFSAPLFYFLSKLLLKV